MFYGYDYDMDRTMLRIGAMNMMIEQYEGQYRSAMYAAVKAANPNWKPGQKFDTSILENVTRESVETTLVKNGNRLVRNSIERPFQVLCKR